MASRSLNVTITGDARSLNRALGSVQKQTDTVGKHVGKISHEAKLAFAGIAGTLGVGGLVEGLKSSVEAAQKAQVSQALMARQLKAVGISYKAHSKAIEEVIAKESALSGLTEHDLQDSFTNIVRATGSVSKGMRGVAIATDLARAKHMDVAKAGVLVAKVYDGNVGALKRLGISLPTVTTAYDKLKASTKHASAEQIAQAKAADKVASGQNAIGVLQKRLAGQAEAYGKTSAGAQDRFRVAVEKLQEKIGKALLPTLTHVADKAAKFVTQMTDGTGAGGRFAKKMDDVFRAVGRVLGTVKDVAGWLGKHPALLAAAGAAWVTYKTVALVNLAISKAAMLGMFGGATRAKMVTQAAATGAASGRAMGGAGSLAAWKASGKLMGAAALGALIYYLQQHQHDTRPFWDRIINPVGPGVGSKRPLKDPSGSNSTTPAGTPGGFHYTPPDSRGNPPSPGHSGLNKHGSKTSSVAGAHRMLAGSVLASASSVGSSSPGPVAHSASSTGSYGLANLICAKFGLRISSGYRSPQYNAAIGGAPHSWHTQGSVSNPGAIDMVGSMGAMQAALAWVRGNVSGLAEAMIDNYAGLGNNLHIAGPGLMNWRGGAGASPGGSVSAPASSTTPAPSTAPTPAAHVVVQKAVSNTGAIPDWAVTNPKQWKQIKQLTAEKQREATDWAGVKAFLTPPKKFAIDKTIDNPLLQAALSHYDNMVAAGLMTPAEANAQKTAVLQNALPHLVGENKLVAQGMIRDLGPAAPGAQLDALSGQLSDIDLQVRAGDLTPDAGRTAKINAINAALPGLTGHDALEARASLGDLLSENSQSTADLATAVQNLADQQAAMHDFAEQVHNTEAGSIKAMLASIVGTHLGVGVASRGLTPAYGVARRS